VIAQAGFSAGLERRPGDRPRFRYFTGAAGDVPLGVVPDQLISQPTPLTAAGTELVLYPAPGGETRDALMVYLPDSGVLFAGDVLMPYLGQPFAGEGSPEGLLEALAGILAEASPGPVLSERVDQIGRALRWEEQAAAVDLDHLAGAGDQALEPVGPGQIEEHVLGGPDDQGGHGQPR
jgi:glyoxylase-like metal-dependent hydrolase (beta-lactamase superfamily II)